MKSKIKDRTKRLFRFLELLTENISGTKRFNAVEIFSMRNICRNFARNCSDEARRTQHAYAFPRRRNLIVEIFHWLSAGSNGFLLFFAADDSSKTWEITRFGYVRFESTLQLCTMQGTTMISPVQIRTWYSNYYPKDFHVNRWIKLFIERFH